MPTIITIPTPCHEDWNAMVPDDKGRHCDSCAKTVVDFTTWQPQEILLHFKTNKNICDRFTEDQLNEPIPTQEDFVRQLAHFKISTLKKVAAIFLFAFMIGASSCNENKIRNYSIAIENSKPVLTSNTTEIITKPIIDSPPQIIGRCSIKKPAVVQKSVIQGDVVIPQKHTLIDDSAIKITSQTLPTCTPKRVKENKSVVMGLAAIEPRKDSIKR